MRRMKGLSKEKMGRLLDTDSVLITRGKGVWWEVGESKGGINGDGRRLDLGW